MSKEGVIEISKYIPTYGEIKKKVIEEKKMNDQTFEEMVDQYQKKFPERLARNRTLMAFLLARDLGIEVRVKKFRTGIHRKIAEIDEEDRGIIIDECYLGGKWESATRSGKPSVRFVIFDDTGVVNGQATGERTEDLKDIEVGDPISIENASVLKLRDGSLLINVTWRTSKITKLKETKLPPIDTYKREIERLEDGKFAIVEGLAVDCERRTYIGCPICNSSIDGKVGEESTCKKCGNTVTAQELSWTTLVINDGTGDVMCEMSPSIEFKDEQIGTMVRVYGTYDSRNDVIAVSHLEPAETPIETYLKPEVTKSEEKPKEPEKVEAPLPTPEATESPEIPDDVINDILAMIKFLPNPPSRDELQKAIEKGEFGDIKVTVDDLIEALLKTGEVKLEGERLVKA